MDELKLPAPAAILRALERGDLTKVQLVKTTGLKTVVVATSLTRLCFLGKVRPKAEKYTLVKEVKE